MAEVNTDRFTGFAELYDLVRPQPPMKVVDIVSQILGRKHFDTVADLGSGTGLSSRIWIGSSDNVIGLEPTRDMIEHARRANPEITFLNVNSYATTLESLSVDVVCCSQAFHWMESVATLKEVARILRPSGAFVVYDCQWPVNWYWPAEQKYEELLKKARTITKSIPSIDQALQQYPKEKHLENMKSSGIFAHCGAVLFDNIEDCDADRFLGIALSQGQVQDVLKHRPEWIEEEILQLTKAAAESRAIEMRVSYTLYYGVKGI